MTRPTAPLGILIVEDEALLAMDLEAMVQDSGHTVVAEAASLPDVASLGEDLCPAIAFVDIQLAQNTSGIDVARLIQRRWPRTVVVYLTANPLKVPDDFAGAHGVIAKPFSRSGVMAAMAFIAEAVMDPPPISAQPTCFTPSAAYAVSWSVGAG